MDASGHFPAVSPPSAEVQALLDSDWDDGCEQGVSARILRLTAAEAELTGRLTKLRSDVATETDIQSRLLSKGTSAKSALRVGVPNPWAPAKLQVRALFGLADSGEPRTAQVQLYRVHRTSLAFLTELKNWLAAMKVLITAVQSQADQVRTAVLSAEELSAKLQRARAEEQAAQVSARVAKKDTLAKLRARVLAQRASSKPAARPAAAKVKRARDTQSRTALAAKIRSKLRKITAQSQDALETDFEEHLQVDNAGARPSFSDTPEFQAAVAAATAAAIQNYKPSVPPGSEDSNAPVAGSHDTISGVPALTALRPQIVKDFDALPARDIDSLVKHLPNLGPDTRVREWVRDMERSMKFSAVLYWHWYPCLVRGNKLDQVVHAGLEAAFQDTLVHCRWQVARDHLLNTRGANDTAELIVSRADREVPMQVGESFFTFSQRVESTMSLLTDMSDDLKLDRFRKWLQPNFGLSTKYVELRAGMPTASWETVVRDIFPRLIAMDNAHWESKVNRGTVPFVQPQRARPQSCAPAGGTKTRWEHAVQVNSVVADTRRHSGPPTSPTSLAHLRNQPDGRGDEVSDKECPFCRYYVPSVDRRLGGPNCMHLLRSCQFYDMPQFREARAKRDAWKATLAARDARHRGAGR